MQDGRGAGRRALGRGGRPGDVPAASSLVLEGSALPMSSRWLGALRARQTKQDAVARVAPVRTRKHAAHACAPCAHPTRLHAVVLTARSGQGVNGARGATRPSRPGIPGGRLPGGESLTLLAGRGTPSTVARPTNEARNRPAGRRPTLPEASQAAEAGGRGPPRARWHGPARPAAGAGCPS